MLNIYLTNLGKYNEGFLIGEWVTLPISAEELEEVKKHIGINEQYEEWFITDYETDIEGVKVGEYDNLDELNELAEILDGMGEDEQKALQAMLLDSYSFNDALEKVNSGDFRIWYGCEDMTDVACSVVEECGYLLDVPDAVKRYFDYESFGRDLDLEGKYYEVDGVIIEIF